MKSLEFWIEYGSTYTYLTVARIGQLASARDIHVDWRPFYLVPILIDQGMNLGPFLPYPNKLNYMWRDIERRAARGDIPYRKPSIYPVDSLLTARIGAVAAREGWCQKYTECVFALHWTENCLIGSPDNLRRALEATGHDVQATVALASSPETKTLLRSNTEEAKQRGIFGAPTFLVGDELFWGDDRLEDALEWAESR